MRAGIPTPFYGWDESELREAESRLKTTSKHHMGRGQGQKGSVMIQSYKFRLYPTQRQEDAMQETLETCRRLYNGLLDDRIKNRTEVFAY